MTFSKSIFSREGSKAAILTHPPLRLSLKIFLRATMAEEVSFRAKVIKAFLWLSAGTFAGQLISWISTLFVIRLLMPQDYGLLAMASSFILLLTTVSELGFGAALVQAESISEKEIRQVCGFVIVSSVAGWAICGASAPAVARFYAEPNLIRPFQALSLNIILIAFYLVPQALLIREMNFKAKAKIDVLAQILSSLTTLLLALAGKGVWSLIFGMSTLHLVKAALYNKPRALRVKPLFHYAGAGKFIRYGLTLTGSRLLYSAYILSDVIIIGKVLDKFSVGIYSVALNLASLPAEKVLPLISQITFTSYSRIQGDMDRVRKNLLATTRALAFAGFPIFFGMAAVAPEAIPLILGEKWLQVVVPFQLLCGILPFKSLSPTVAATLNAVGEPGVTLTNTAIAAATMIIAFLVGARYGIIGVCLAWVIAYSFVFLVTTLRSMKALAVPAGDFFGAIRFPLSASLLMLGVIFLLKRLVPDLPHLHALVLFVSLGAASYLGTAFMFKPDEYRELRKLLQRGS
jgi:teichuronic acid exporter